MVYLDLVIITACNMSGIMCIINLSVCDEHRLVCCLSFFALEAPNLVSTAQCIVCHTQLGQIQLHGMTHQRPAK